MKTMWKALVCGVALSAAVLAWSASPASADHFLAADEDGCTVGPIFLITTELHTDQARITTRRDGTVVVRCLFRGLPDHVSEEESPIGVEYVAAKHAVTTDVLCGHPFEEDFAYGTFRITPGGIGVATCTFPPN